MRKHFQESIGATFASAVEHMTGRRVIAFLGETHIDPPFSVEFFGWHRPSACPAGRVTP